MADEGGGGGPVEDLFFILGVIVVLVVLWFATGGNKKADLRGIFLHPPQPVGTGGAYGPTLQRFASTTNNQ